LADQRGEGILDEVTVVDRRLTLGARILSTGTPNVDDGVPVIISSSGSGQMLPLKMNEYIQQTLAEIGIEIEYEVDD
ncbi:hypothetical protein, partial [Rhizobium johnstonii]|uniref:hypothetical protein n=1 Tax=Rhizobium johnstonii TaxID=3019933 RepID=UPI003F985B3A